MSAPAVSVLMTTYEHARFVEESLGSLLAQTNQDFETIITDDASGDGTPDIIQAWLDRTGFPARFIRNPVNRGICANRNQALTLARGRFVCSLSGDDAYTPDRIERQVAFFCKQPTDVAAVYSDASLVDAEGKDLGGSFLVNLLGDEPPPEGADFFDRLLLVNTFLPAPGVMVRREALNAVGPYDESLFYEDLFMWLELSHRFRFQFLPGCLIRYRVLPSSMSHSDATRAAMAESTVRILNTWRGRCGTQAQALDDRIWYLSLEQLLRGSDHAARRMMLVVAAGSRRWRRRTAARLAALPAGCNLLRRADRLYPAARSGALALTQIILN